MNQMPDTSHKFDPADPVDAMIESIAAEIIGIAAKVGKITIYREMEVNVQISCFVTGVAAGLAAVGLTMSKPEGYEEMMNYIQRNCGEIARHNAQMLFKDMIEHRI